MGRICVLCGYTWPNEHFGGKGERARTCRQCRALPREKRDAIKHEIEIRHFLDQSHISKRNIARLKTLASSNDARIAQLATLVWDVAKVTPHRRKRIRYLAGKHREIITRMELAGLIMPRPVFDDDPDEFGLFDELGFVADGVDTLTDDLDPLAAWEEWAEFAAVEGEG